MSSMQQIRALTVQLYARSSFDAFSSCFPPFFHSRSSFILHAIDNHSCLYSRLFPTQFIIVSVTLPIVWHTISIKVRRRCFAVCCRLTYCVRVWMSRFASPSYILFILKHLLSVTLSNALHLYHVRHTHQFILWWQWQHIKFRERNLLWPSDVYVECLHKNFNFKTILYFDIFVSLSLSSHT